MKFKRMYRGRHAVGAGHARALLGAADPEAAGVDGDQKSAQRAPDRKAGPGANAIAAPKPGAVKAASAALENDLSSLLRMTVEIKQA